MRSFLKMHTHTYRDNNGIWVQGQPSIQHPWNIFFLGGGGLRVMPNGTEERQLLCQAWDLNRQPSDHRHKSHIGAVSFLDVWNSQEQMWAYNTRKGAGMFSLGLNYHSMLNHHPILNIRGILVTLFFVCQAVALLGFNSSSVHWIVALGSVSLVHFFFIKHISNLLQVIFHTAVKWSH